MAYLPILAAPLLGYLLGWFFWGVPLPFMLLLLCGGAWLWTSFPDRHGAARGGWSFFRALAALALMAFIVWAAFWMVIGVFMVSSPYNPLPLTWSGLISLLALGVLACAVSLILLRRLADQAIDTADGSSAFHPGKIAPWLWLAGVLLFAFYPAVRVDCRGLNTDKYRTYRDGFLDASGGYWARHPEVIPGQRELPADFKPADVQSGVTRCHQTAQGRPRLFTWQASTPVVLVYLSNKTGKRYYAAAFMPGDHRKLTPWTAAPKPWGTWKTEMPYLNPFWRVDEVLPELPAALARVLKP